MTVAVFGATLRANGLIELAIRMEAYSAVI